MSEEQGINAGVHDSSGKQVIQETSRPENTKTYFTSEGDDTSDITKVGGSGVFLDIEHTNGSGNTESVIIDFNISENKTYIHEGYIQWSNALGDCVSLEIIPHITTVNADTSTDFKLYNNYLIVHSSFPVGDVINVNEKTTVASLTHSDVKLVEMPISRDSGVRPQAFWNADWNTTTKEYENITSAPSGDGEFNLFSYPVTLDRFVNKIKLRNNGFMMLQTADTNEIGQNMRIKLIGNTINDDHDWQLSSIITMHREKTV